MRSAVDDVKNALLNQLNSTNPYGDDAEINASASLSDDGSEIKVTIEFNGIRDPDVVIDPKALSKTIVSESQKALSTDQFKNIVDVQNLAVKVQLPPTVTNTAQMAEKLLDGNFTPAMAENYGCSSQGYFNAFEPTLGKPRDATDSAFFKWKKCIQCATGNKEFMIGAYDYDETDQVCRETNRAFCECDLALITYLKTAQPVNTTFDATTCSAADHQSELECCNWQQHYWAAYNPDHHECDTIDGLKQVGSF